MPPTGIDLHDAKAIVQWVLGVHLERAVPSGSGGATGSAGGQDFDLSEGGRRTGAMVVARSVATSHPQTWGSVTRLRWGAGGRRSWAIRLEAVTRSGPDERMIVGLLAELEGAGGAGFQRADQVRVAALRAAGVRLSPAERVIEDLAAFGVVGAESRFDPEEPPTVAAKASEAACTYSEAINEVVEDEAWRPTNRARLTGSDVDERHLFVWLDPANTVANDAMDPDEVPAPPLLAPETTTLWVARRPPTDGGFLADRVWQTNATGEWEALAAVRGRRVLAPASPG